MPGQSRSGGDGQHETTPNAPGKCHGLCPAAVAVIRAGVGLTVALVIADGPCSHPRGRLQDPFREPPAVHRCRSAAGPAARARSTSRPISSASTPSAGCRAGSFFIATAAVSTVAIASWINSVVLLDQKLRERRSLTYRLSTVIRP
jgi:hypothetical protein